MQDTSERSACGTYGEEGRVGVGAVGHADAVAAQLRRGDARRQGEVHGRLAALQGRERDLRGLLRGRVALVGDDVDLGGVVGVGGAAVDEARLLRQLAQARHLGGAQEVRDLQEHGAASIRAAPPC